MRYVVLIIVIVIGMVAITGRADDFKAKATKSAVTIEEIADKLEESEDIKQAVLQLRAEAHYLRSKTQHD